MPDIVEPATPAPPPTRRTALRVGAAAVLAVFSASALAASESGRMSLGGRQVGPTASPTSSGPRPSAAAGDDLTGGSLLDPSSTATLGPDGRPAWTPATPLPAAEPAGGRPVVVVLSPHPDDETLSLGVWAANAAARGDRVIVVCLTDGRTTGAITSISRRLGHPVTRDEIAAARERELRAAIERLGVARDDLYLPHLDGDATVGGTRLTVAEAYAVIEAFARRFPDATFGTMSYAAEHHPDHLDLGRALWLAERARVVRHAEFAVSRLWWALPSPPVREVLPDTLEVRDRVLAAAREYGVWDPAAGRYAVGYTSVDHQFTALLADPRSRVHAAGEVLVTPSPLPPTSPLPSPSHTETPRLADTPGRHPTP